MAQKVTSEPELLPPRTLISKGVPDSSTLALAVGGAGERAKVSSERPLSKARSKATKPPAKRADARKPAKASPRKAKPSVPDDLDD